MGSKYSYDGAESGLSVDLWGSNPSLDPNTPEHAKFRRASASVAGPDEKEFAG